MVLPREPPRDVAALGLETAIGFMIRVRVFVAWLLIVGGALMIPVGLLMLAVAARKGQPMVGGLGVSAVSIAQLSLALWWRSRLKQARARRRQALEHGRPIRGVVSSVTSAPGLSLAMGSLDRRFSITYQGLDGTRGETAFTSPLGLASSWLEPGAPVEGLMDPETGDVLFPAELGLNVTFQ